MSIKDISDIHQAAGPEALKRMLESAEPAMDVAVEAEAKAAPTPAALPEIYYSLSSKEYFLQADNGAWIPVNENSVKRHLKALGFKHGKNPGGSLTPMEKCLNEIQKKQSVAYAAPLAGYDAGFYRINGNNILVTHSPKPIEPEPGKFPILEELLKRMFVTDVTDQRPYIYGWLKTQIQALREKRWAPGQALAMCGPVNCGKSLFQRLITEMLGGRSGKPYQFMTDRTNFNEDLFEAEHLMIEDDAESTQYAQRKAFGSHIKAFAVNRDHRCHGKHKKGLMLTPRWRVTISVNDEPQRLLVLPPIDQDTEDKIVLLKVNPTTMPMPLETNEQRDLFWSTLIGELPAFIDFLLKWEIPEDLRSPRFGIIHFHHPQILSAVDEMSHELRLLDLIDQRLSFQNGESWTGTAQELQSKLTGEESKVQYDARQLFNFPNACGMFLASLSKKKPHRVQKALRRTDKREWTINPIQGKLYNGMVISKSSNPEQN